jgi:hypothetical protein
VRVARAVDNRIVPWTGISRDAALAVDAFIVVIRQIESTHIGNAVTHGEDGRVEDPEGSEPLAALARHCRERRCVLRSLSVGAIALSGFRSALAGSANLLPVGLAVVVTTIANGLLSSGMKDRLVFLRWHHALPGHRAFSVYAKADPRIDFGRLQRALGNKIPSDPAGENKAWYRFYLEVQNVPAVQQVHRDFLLLRDYTGLPALFLICLGLAALFLIATWKVLAIEPIAGFCLRFRVQRRLQFLNTLRS